MIRRHLIEETQDGNEESGKDEKKHRTKSDTGDQETKIENLI